MFARVLVGTDGSDTATRAVEAAAELARAHRSVLMIGHAFAPEPTGRQQQAWAEAPEKLSCRLTVGAIADQTVQAAIDHVHRTVNDDLQVFGHREPGRPVPAPGDATRFSPATQPNPPVGISIRLTFDARRSWSGSGTPSSPRGPKASSPSPSR